MSPRILKFFKGDRKYFTVVFFLLLLILVSALVTPVIIRGIEDDWNVRVNKETARIESEVINQFRSEENFLLQKSHGLKKGLREVLNPKSVSYGNILDKINNKDYDGLAVEVYAPNGRLIGWNKNSPVLKEIPFPMSFGYGEAYFTTTALMTWLTVTDTLDFEAEHFYTVIHLPFQKHYVINNPYYKEIDFTRKLSGNLLTNITFIYTGNNEPEKDGRYYTFNLLNHKEHRIAQVTFLKPLLDNAVNYVKDLSSKIQGILLVLVYFVLFFAFRHDFHLIENRITRFLLVALYLIGFRVLLFILNIPAAFLDGVLDDPSYFSSMYGWGIVKSPVEFLISNIFLLILVIKLFLYLRQAYRRQKKNKYLYFILILPAAFIFLMTARGLNAAVKSIIFDSSLRYFSSQDIIPGIPELVMHLNLLILSIIVVVLLLSILLVPLSFIKREWAKYFWITFILILAAGYFFVVLQPHPLITPVMQVVFISLVFLVYWQFRRKTDSVYIFVYIAVAASVISISLLNYHNQHLERESLKTTALELNRPNDNLLNFLLRESLRISSNDEKLINAYGRMNTNYHGLAFTAWSGSPLQRESLSSSVMMLDRNKKLLGQFNIGLQDDTSPEAYTEYYKGDEIQISEVQKDTYRRVFKGIAPVKKDGTTAGFITMSVVFDPRNPSGVDYPDFLISQKNFLNPVVDASQLKIFEILNSRLTYVYGDIYPSRDQIKPIINTDYGNDNESWQVITLNNERYLAYALKNLLNGDEKITVVLYREKQITWNLFNFFKVFVVHVLYILILFLVLFAVNIRKFRYTFRMQLLTAFLLISVIPVITLAVYNRQAVEERSRNAVFNELNERLEYIENHITSQMRKHNDRDFNDAFVNAAGELGISFNVYENTTQTFSSKEQYYRSGLFNQKLNPAAHYQLNYLSYREFLSVQEVENYPYNSFYKKLNIEGKDLILGVDDAFNKVKLSFTSADADIFLFGIYSFAVIIIIIINTLLANKISAPIRQLIRAADAVGKGDLSVQIQNKERGELRDLVDGFNSMTRELQKNETELAQMERETAWKEMAKQVAHEIKNPLTPMKLAVQQMIISFRENKNFEGIFNRVTETLLNQIENLNQIASEFSRFARMPHFNLEKVNLSVVLNDTLNLFADEKIKISLVSDIQDAYVEADNSQFRRVLINMIRNSIQSGADKLSISLSRCEEGFEIIIEDNGSGIKPEYQERIFEPDFTTKEKGMGIGLKLARRFIEGVKGSITLVKSSDEGTTFRIYIPELR
jgi:two-component system, NtrC family, nitrogen regulation sensor histidine kinase NtrY